MPIVHHRRLTHIIMLKNISPVSHEGWLFKTFPQSRSFDSTYLPKTSSIARKKEAMSAVDPDPNHPPPPPGGLHLQTASKRTQRHGRRMPIPIPRQPLHHRARGPRIAMDTGRNAKCRHCCWIHGTHTHTNTGIEMRKEGRVRLRASSASSSAFIGNSRL